MKYAIIAALVVFALAQGSFAQDAPDFERVGQYLEEMKTKMTQEVNKLLQNDLASQAQTLIEGSKTQMESIAPQVQEQFQSMLSTVEEQVKPLQAQMEPILKNFQKEMESFLQKLTEQAKAIAN